MADRERGPFGGILIIVLAGVLLGLTYNEIGRRSRRPWGLDWVGRDRYADLAGMEVVRASDGAGETGSSLYSGSDDPLAMGAGPAGAAEGLPEIPAIGRAVPIDAGALKQYVDASAALIVDARDAWEFAEGHIPGAISLPFDEAITDPVALEQLDSGGRPIITYCGGGSCEVSLSLAEELFFAGHERVAVYMGGFPEWQELGYEVSGGTGAGTTGATGGRR